MDQFAGLINERIEVLRRKLQDTSRRNPLIHNVLRAKSGAFLRIVDEKPQSIFDHLVSAERSIVLAPLPPLDIDPADEESTEFKNAFLNAQLTDETYLKAIEKIDFETDEKAFDAQENADRALKDRLREALDLPPRPKFEQLSDRINHAKSHGINPSSSLPLPSAESADGRFDDHELQTLLFPKTFQSRLARILSKARMYQEERGLDVIYIVLGYLKWTLPNAEAQDEFKSPLLLIPVSLTKNKSLSGETYSVSKLADPVLNPSLEHKLTVEAKLDLSQIKELVETDSIDVEGLFEAIASLKPKNMRWTVAREASFGIYPFQGIELYHDLDTQSCDFVEFPIVKELMIGRDADSSIGSSTFSEKDVESSIGKGLVPHIVLDSDSSQFISLLKVANNENVALEGPPGSGKSQTIVNAIANAIHSGKKVLFVAQKVTALEVVFSRLQSLGLHQFVLPLMGGHGSTDEFYEAVADRLAIRPPPLYNRLDNLKAQYETYRNQLSEYIDVLTSSVSGTGMCVHQVLGFTVSNSETIKKLPLELQSIDVYPDKLVKDFSPSDIDAMASQIADLYERLVETEITSASVWADSDAETIDIDLVNKSLLDAAQASIEIETSLSKVNGSERRLVDDLLSNSLKAIEYQIQELSRDRDLLRVHELSLEKGTVELGQSLHDLVEIDGELSAYKSNFRLSDERLSIVGNSKSSLIRLKTFVDDYGIEEITVGTIEATRNDLLARKSSLEQLLSIKSGIIDQLLSGITIEQILSYAALLKHQEEIRSFREYLLQVGIEGARQEIRKTRQLFRTRSHIFSSEDVPSIPELSNLKNTIQNSGIFSFLSKTVKSAKREAGRILASADTKLAMLERLEEAQGFVKEWTGLEISNHVNISDESLSDQLSVLLSILDELEVLNNKSNTTLFSALSLLMLEELEDLLGLLKTNNAHSMTWNDVESEASSIDSRISGVQDSLNELNEAERIFAGLGCQTGMLQDLASSSEIINDLRAKRARLLETLGANFDDCGHARKMLGAHESYAKLPESSVQIAFDSNGQKTLEILENLLPAFSLSGKSLATLLSAKGNDVAVEEMSVSKILGTLGDHRSDQTGFNKLMTRRSVLREAKSAGIENLVKKMAGLELSQDFVTTVRAALAASLQRQVQKTFGSLLMQFDGKSLSFARERIRSLDRKIIEISQHKVARSAMERANPPRGNSFGKKSTYTDLALLEHELQKQRRTPPRKILKRANRALMELFPCWMMVPSAVAQHLPRKTDFDLVIIDEASQMTPENSISALMRAKNAFIAGDTNQLPPTNFFKGLSIDEDEDEDVTTTEESILELANVQFHPKHRLLWHYRSRHEDLIAFSNHYVYDSELVIFPSPTPTTKGLGISLVEVNGTFQRGINMVEAQVMLEAIVQFMRDNPDRSLGVAVMNQSQMEQLEALVLREAETNRTVSNYLDKWATARQGLEKFFVKNLENVQGDERDAIFIGTVYGRDAQGKFYQRFGPINGSAGKRRLNVLFSRAKEQIVTFSSIPLGDFNPSPTNEGATLLRRWLEFSATKRLGEVAHNHDRAGHTDSPFEDHVLEAVRSLGYEAVPQVGVSSYFIDIGVKHASYPLGYICGIECDGATYHSSKSARDRDRLREEVLIRLGWDLYRIWSTDWFRDPLGCRDVLRAYLAERLDGLLKDMDETDQSEKIQPEVRVTSQKISEPVSDSGVEDVILESKGVIPTSHEEVDTVRIGSKLLVRFLNGPRAGALHKLWFQEKTNDPNFSVGEHRSIGTDSPLGAALEDAQVDDIVTFKVKDKEIRVEIIELENT